MPDTNIADSAQAKSQVEPSSSLETVSKLDLELERHGDTLGTINSAASSDFFKGKNSPSGLEGTATTLSLSDDQDGTLAPNDSKGFQGLDTLGDKKESVLTAVEEQPPGTLLQVQHNSWNLRQQPSKVPPPSLWPHQVSTREKVSQHASPNGSQDYSRETAAAGATRETNNVWESSTVDGVACPASRFNPHPQQVDATGRQVQPLQYTDACEASTAHLRSGPQDVDVVDATGRGRKDWQASLPQRSSFHAVGYPAAEIAYPSRKAGLPPRPGSWEAGISSESRLARIGKQGQHSPPLNFMASSSKVATTRESRNLSARAAAAAAAAAAVLGHDFRAKSESNVEAPFHSSLAPSTQRGQVAAVAPMATVSGFDPGSRATPGRAPGRRRAFFGSKEGLAQRKGHKIMNYLKGSLTTAGDERANVSCVTIATSNDITQQRMPAPDAAHRVRTPASTPGTRRKGSTHFSTPGAWRSRSASTRRSDSAILPNNLEADEKHERIAAAPSGVLGTAVVAGTETPTDGDAGHTLALADKGVVDYKNDDNDMLEVDKNIDGHNAARSDSPAGAVCGEEERTPAMEEKDGGGTIAVAPEDLEEEIDEKEEEQKEQELEAVVSESCSFTGLLECACTLRVDGKLAGELVSTGSVTVGRTGSIIGDLRSIKFLLVDGQVTGNVWCDTVVIGDAGKVFGNITSESITIGPEAMMRGKLDVVENISEARAHAFAQDEIRPLMKEEEEEVESVESKTPQDSLKAKPGVKCVATDVEARAGDSHNEAELDAAKGVSVTGAEGKGCNSQEREMQDCVSPAFAEEGEAKNDVIDTVDAAGNARSAKADAGIAMVDSRAAEVDLSDSRLMMGQAVAGASEGSVVGASSTEPRHSDQQEKREDL